jgi:hypothetical protein
MQAKWYRFAKFQDISSQFIGCSIEFFKRALIAFAPSIINLIMEDG